MPSLLPLPSLSRPLRLVFMGTPEFAVPALQALLESEDTVVGVVCQPDKPAGRRLDLHAPPVKDCARVHAVPVFQPQNIRTPEALEHLHGWRPDLIVIAAYGKIIPKTMLDLPLCGCINIHASLLPKYRGAAPMQWAIAQGETHSGITIMQVNEQLDAGDILLQKSVALRPDETGGSLHDTLAALGAQALLAALTLFKQGKLVATPQDQAAVTYAPLLKKEDGEIDWTRSAVNIERRIRAYHPGRPPTPGWETAAENPGRASEHGRSFRRSPAPSSTARTKGSASPPAKAASSSTACNSKAKKPCPQPPSSPATTSSPATVSAATDSLLPASGNYGQPWETARRERRTPCHAPVHHMIDI